MTLSLMVGGLPLLAVPFIVIAASYLLWQIATGDVGYDEEQLYSLTGFKVGDEE